MSRGADWWVSIQGLWVAIESVGGFMVSNFPAAGREKLSFLLFSLHKAVGAL